MERLVVLCCLIGVIAAAGQRQVKLEDIERDNVANERNVQQARLVKQTQNFVQPKAEYGFLPVKNSQNYAQQQAQLVQEQPQQQQQQQPQLHPQLFTPEQYYYQQNVGASKAQQYVQARPEFQNFNGLQYITNNQLQQDYSGYQPQQQQQQYYNPQYVYLQQYPAATNSVPNVVDTKGNLQYVMYVPAQYLQNAEQTQNIQTFLQPQAYSGQPEAYSGQAEAYTTGQDYTTGAGVSGGIQYVQQEQPKSSKYTEVLYVQPETRKPKQNFHYVNAQRGPQSLLDSYVPSILQVQYQKQVQQARHNAIQQNRKVPPTIVGKTDIVKGFPNAYATQTAGFDTSALNFNIPVQDYSSHK